MYKSRGLCAIFQLFGAASIQVRLLFEGGLYAMFWVCKTRESSLARRKMHSESETWLCECHEIVSKRTQAFWHAKSGWTKLYMDNIGPPFSSCGFYLSAVYVQLEFGERVASIRVRLLRPCAFFSVSRHFFHQTYAGARKKNKMPKEKNTHRLSVPGHLTNKWHTELIVLRAVVLHQTMIELNSFQSPRKFDFSWYLTFLRGQRTFSNLFNRNFHQHCECIRLAEIAR